MRKPWRETFARKYFYNKSHDREVCNECKCNYNELKIIWRLHLLRFWYLAKFWAVFVGWMSPQRKHCSRIRLRIIFPISPKMFWNFFDAKTWVSVDLGGFKGSCCELEWPWAPAECQPGEQFWHFSILVSMGSINWGIREVRQQDMSCNNRKAAKKK